MKTQLKDIAYLMSGIYAKPDILADIYYLQGNHFVGTGEFDPAIKPQLKLNNKYEKQLLQNDDILFAAKGFNNFAVVYHESIGKAVASSSFIIIRMKSQYVNKVFPEYLKWLLSNSPQIEEFYKQKPASTVPSISIGQLSALEIEIPDYNTQQLIVNTYECRAKEVQLIRQLEKLKDKKIQFTVFNTIKRQCN